MRCGTSGGKPIIREIDICAVRVRGSLQLANCSKLLWQSFSLLLECRAISSIVTCTSSTSDSFLFSTSSPPYSYYCSSYSNCSSPIPPASTSSSHSPLPSPPASPPMKSPSPSASPSLSSPLTSLTPLPSPSPPQFSFSISITRIFVTLISSFVGTIFLVIYPIIAFWQFGKEQENKNKRYVWCFFLSFPLPICSLLTLFSNRDTYR